jgi:hypothetical protein
MKSKMKIIFKNTRINKVNEDKIVTELIRIFS